VTGSSLQPSARCPSAVQARFPGRRGAKLRLLVRAPELRLARGPPLAVAAFARPR